MFSFPIPTLEEPHFKESCECLTKLTKILADHQKKYREANKRLPRLLQNKYPNLQVSKKISEWYSGSYADFLKEIKRQKITWSLREEAEWMEYFIEEQSIIRSLQDEIKQTDAEIDRLVYQLYDLTEAEIAIVESALG